ncbi:MAG: alpha/beta hydrolase [Proteobacteria bacterium]|nr:alpha/beta hydrolase [Pseudomonadota bacterium]
MPFTTIKGLRTFYEVHGRGETIVLLHNGFSCVKMWRDIYPGLVRAGYQVVMYDRRGYGLSEEGPDFPDFYVSDGFREASVQAMAALMKHLGLDRFHIVGQCEGGVVGLDYAIRYPDQVRTLTTASTLCFLTTTLEEFNRAKFPDSFQGLTPRIQGKYFDWHGPERAEAFFNLCSRYGGEYGRGVFDLRGDLPQVTRPVLVMYPDRGHFFEVEQGVAFYRGLPRGELAVFPRCGHNIHEHYPEDYARQVLSFLSRHEGSEA